MLYRLACTCMCILVLHRRGGGGARNSSQRLVPRCDLATYNISDIFRNYIITFSDYLRTVRWNYFECQRM